MGSGAKSGGITGALMGGNIGAALGYISGNGADKAARAAQNAAQQQQAAAQANYNNISRIANETTAQGFASFDQALKAQDKNISRQEQLVSQIDPTIIEASQQALRLLRGESSSTLAPLQQQRDVQRQKLLNSLREQLGPGAETSTAGIQALTRFDAESSNLFATAQQQALGNVSNVFGQFSNSKPNLGNEISTFGQLAQGRAGLGYQQAGILGGAYQGVINTAGANQTGALLQGQQQQAMANQLLQTGSTIASAAIMAKSGAASVPSASTQIGSTPKTLGNQLQPGPY